MTQDFWAMGGYARFVWPCIGFALAVLAWNLLAARRSFRRALERARRAIAMANV
jgi:heme exporter protein CcmD